MEEKKKLTKKQETFVDLMVYQDYKQTKCAHLAGYENPGVAATRLLSDQQYAHVQEKIMELKAVQRAKNEITFEGIATKLGEIRDVALADGSYGPAVTAEIARFDPEAGSVDLGYVCSVELLSCVHVNVRLLSVITIVSDVVSP